MVKTQVRKDLSNKEPVLFPILNFFDDHFS
jgi:hypothetical protein